MAMGLIVITAIVIGIVMVAMSVGVLFSNRCLRGSCGGPDVIGPDGESLACATCPHRNDSSDSVPSSEAA